MANEEYSLLKHFYDSDDFAALMAHEHGSLWIKLHTLRRRSYLQKLSEQTGINVDKKKINLLLERIFDELPDESIIEELIREEYMTERSVRIENETALVSELHKVRDLNWGGLQGNQLERTIVDRYIKKITHFDELSEKIEGEIHDSLRGYVISSWYNHWTSILIEDIFKDHPRVLPAIGKIAKVDFLVDGVPFDLKVTYFPAEYMAQMRKRRGLPVELSAIKKIAKMLDIKFDTQQSPKEILSELVERLRTHHSEAAKDFIMQWESETASIIDEAIADSFELRSWFYSNQGDRRYDASNRLFLVLINKRNPFESWKMKRAVDRLRYDINGFCDTFRASDFATLEMPFERNGETLRAFSTAIFVVQS